MREKLETKATGHLATLQQARAQADATARAAMREASQLLQLANEIDESLVQLRKVLRHERN